MVLRQSGTDDRVILRNEIQSHKVSRRSLMPEGLIDVMASTIDKLPTSLHI